MPGCAAAGRGSGWRGSSGGPRPMAPWMPAARVVGDAGEDRLDLERRQARVLRHDPSDEPGNVRRREAVPGGRRPTAILPCDRDVDAPGTELDRRQRVVVQA